MMLQLTDNQAYCAMFHFLEAHYRRTGSDDVGDLLGDLSTMEGGTPADPAVSGDWQAAVEAACDGAVDPRLQLDQTGEKPASTKLRS